jgi:hypothetical protein
MIRKQVIKLIFWEQDNTPDHSSARALHEFLRYADKKGNNEVHVCPPETVFTTVDVRLKHYQREPSLDK